VLVLADVRLAHQPRWAASRTKTVSSGRAAASCSVVLPLWTPVAAGVCSLPSWLDFSRGLVPIARAWHAWRGHQTRAGLMLLAISDCRPPELPRRLCCFYVSALTCRGRRRRYSAPHRRKFPATSAVGGRRRPVLSMRGTGYIQGKSASRGCQQLRAAMPGCQPRATRQARRTSGGAARGPPAI